MNDRTSARLRSLCAAFTGAFTFLPAHANAQGGHVHGAGTLQVAVEGERLSLQFSSPLDNLVGFERAPRTDREKERVRQMVERLQKAEELFKPSPEARCSRSSVTLDSPILDGKAAKGGHAALTASIEFRCQQPQNLKSMTVAIFDPFPKLVRVDAQVAGAKKQRATRITSGSRTLSW
ncbi:MAG: DUF2796 domain-containing protein [Burkholderiales bacterium]